MAKGKVVQVIGPVVDIEFPAEALPPGKARRKRAAVSLPFRGNKKTGWETPPRFWAPACVFILPSKCQDGLQSRPA